MEGTGAGGEKEANERVQKIFECTKVIDKRKVKKSLERGQVWYKKGKMLSHP